MAHFPQFPVCAHGCNHNCVYGCFQHAGPHQYTHGGYPNPNLDPVQAQYGAPMVAPQYQFPPAQPNFYPPATSFSNPHQYPQQPFHSVQQQQPTFAQPAVQHNVGSRPPGVANFPYYVRPTNGWGPSHPLLPIRRPGTPPIAPVPATSTTATSAPAPAPVATVGTVLVSNSVTSQSEVSGPDSDEGVLSKSRSDTRPESETVITPDHQTNFQPAPAGSPPSQTVDTVPSNAENSDVKLTDTRSSGVTFLPQEFLERLEAEDRARERFAAEFPNAVPVDNEPSQLGQSYNAILDDIVYSSIQKNKTLEQASSDEVPQAQNDSDIDLLTLWLQFNE